MSITICSSFISCLLDSNNNNFASSLNTNAAICSVSSIVCTSILHMFILKFIFEYPLLPFYHNACC